MKILFISDYYPPYVKAGAEVSTSLLVRWLVRHGNAVSVACSKFCEKPWVEGGASVYPIIFKPSVRSGSFVSAVWSGFAVVFRQMASTVRVLKLIRKLQPDIVNAVTYSRLHPIIIGIRIFSGRPIVVDCRAYDLICPAHLSSAYLGEKKGFDEEIQTHHGYRCIGYTSANDPSFLSIRPFAIYESGTFNVYKFLIRFLVNHFDGMTLAAVSQYVQNQLILNGFDAKKTTNIPNISEMAERPTEPEFEPPAFAYAGRIERDKGIWDLVAAVEILRRDLKQPFEVKIAGTGGEMDALQKHIKEKKLDCVTLLGHITPKEVLDLYGRSLAIIAPSRWPEPLGRFVLESMSAGKPVIGTRTGGITESVEDGKTGLLVDPGNAEQLAAAMKFFVEDGGRSRTMKNAIIKKQEGYRDDVIGGRRMALYKGMLGN